MENANANNNSKRNVLILLIVVVLAIVLAGVGLLIWFMNYKTEKATEQAAPAVALKAPEIKLSLIATGLTAPTGITATPNAADKRLFALEQAGVIQIITSEGTLEAKPFLDIKNRVLTGGEMGLLGLTFHPEYKKNGYFYVNYIDKEQNTVIARYKISANANEADPESEKVLFKVKQPYSNHNGGDLAFGPDGFLYASLGDGGSAGDPENRAQDKGNFLGKILRLDVDKGDPYEIPTSNPFVDEAGTKPEIWALGLRNPWRISFDKQTGDLYIADVGQGTIEEIDVQKASSKGGENYGWRCYEGNNAFNTDECLTAKDYVAPVAEYNHEDGRCSVTGGYVYRGKSYPALAGKYFYGDYCNGQLFYLSQKDGEWTQTMATKTPYSISAFGQGSDGELYLADFKTGSVYKLQDVAN